MVLCCLNESHEASVVIEKSPDGRSGVRELLFGAKRLTRSFLSTPGARLELGDLGHRVGVLEGRGESEKRCLPANESQSVIPGIF